MNVLKASAGLEQLQREPSRLRTEADRVTHELQTLVLDNYKVFARTLSVSARLRREGDRLAGVRRELGKATGGVEGEGAAFRKAADPLLLQHRRNRKTLRFQMELIELLEVPQLVDACARNGLHEEALELACFVNSLEQRNLLATSETSRGSAVVQAVVGEVHKTLLGLRDTLLALLREHESVAEQLGTLGVVRRLDLFVVDRMLALEMASSESAVSTLPDKQREALRSLLLRSAETKLQMEFLEARTAWMAGLSEGGKRGQGQGQRSAELGPYGRTIEMLEMCRAAWFSITTQFNALFEEAQGVTPASNILSCWMARQIDELLLRLRALVLLVDDGVSLKSVVEQTLLFGRRMGQIGCDFSSLALPLFEQCMGQRVGALLGAAVENLRGILRTERLLLKDEFGDVSAEQTIPLFAILDSDQPEGETEGGAIGGLGAIGGGDLAAPASLLRFPPLGYLLNCLLAALNYVRECPVRNTRGAVYHHVRRALLGARQAVLTEATGVAAKGVRYFGAASANSPPLDVQYEGALVQVLAPHVVLCLELVFASEDREGLPSADPASWTAEGAAILADLAA